jgi:hypothetical protein
MRGGGMSSPDFFCAFFVPAVFITRVGAAVWLETEGAGCEGCGGRRELKDVDENDADDNDEDHDEDDDEDDDEEFTCWRSC